MNLYELSELITPSIDGEPALHLVTATVVANSTVPWQINLSGAIVPADVMSAVMASIGSTVVVLVRVNAPPLVLGMLATATANQVPKLIETAPGVGGTTSGTTDLTVCSVTVPAQGVPGKVYVSVHAYVTFSTSGDQFECYIADSDAPTTRVVSSRVNVISGTIREANVEPHAVFSPDGTDSETYNFRLVRTAGTGTATAFADSVYLRMSALWIPT